MYGIGGGEAGALLLFDPSRIDITYEIGRGVANRFGWISNRHVSNFSGAGFKFVRSAALAQQLVVNDQLSRTHTVRPYDGGVCLEHSTRHTIRAHWRPGLCSMPTRTGAKEGIDLKSAADRAKHSGRNLTSSLHLSSPTTASHRSQLAGDSL